MSDSRYSLILLLVTLPGIVLGQDVDATRLARGVTIYRDAWGVPHVDGETDEHAIFGFAYAQAEDVFWQIEESYIKALGRSAEIHGDKELEGDLLNRAFEIPAASRADFENSGPDVRSVAEAFVAGLNFYLDTHPEVKPRLIRRFEPWHVLAFTRALVLDFCFRYTRFRGAFQGVEHEAVRRRGSNAWAVAPARTRDGHALLLINPHQPWYGHGQFYEIHMRSGEGWNFTGATFPGSPIPSLGHNEHAAWSFTVNEPDIADVWIETFDDPENPLAYRHGDGHRMATEWKDTIRVKTRAGIEERRYTFRKTHHGPVVGTHPDGRPVTAMIAGLSTGFGGDQALALLRVRGLEDFKRAMGLLQFPLFNAVYADRHGDIFYLYNGAIPRRDPSFDWSRPVEGKDPRTDWKGMHSLAELPQVANPRAGYVQSCNSSPFLVTGGSDDPKRERFPAYMAEDAGVDKRRAKLSRMLLEKLEMATLDDLRALAFDTTLYWPLKALPELARELDALEKRSPELAARARPLFEHFSGWSCRVEPESTEATLCVAWYQELFGRGYPGERLRSKYRANPALKFQALVDASRKLELYHGTWKVPYGDVNRLQRHANVADFYSIPFSDDLPSLPCVGAPGPLGIVFTIYYTPSVIVPFVRTLRKRYAIVGSSYMAVVELGDRIRGESLLQHGQSGDPTSPHFFDQARLMSERRMKPQLFYWEDVKAKAVRSYRPGER